MAGSEWCTGGIRINRRVIKDKPNNYMPTTRRPMQRSKQYLLADTLAVARRIGAIRVGMGEILRQRWPAGQPACF